MRSRPLPVVHLLPLPLQQWWQISRYSGGCCNHTYFQWLVRFHSHFYSGAGKATPIAGVSSTNTAATSAYVARAPTTYPHPTPPKRLWSLHLPNSLGSRNYAIRLDWEFRWGGGGIRWSLLLASNYNGEVPVWAVFHCKQGLFCQCCKQRCYFSCGATRS